MTWIWPRKIILTFSATSLMFVFEMLIQLILTIKLFATLIAAKHVFWHDHFSVQLVTCNYRCEVSDLISIHWSINIFFVLFVTFRIIVWILVRIFTKSIC